MCEKSPGVAYLTRRIRTTARSEIVAIINDSPLSDNDRLFLIDILHGYSYKELAARHDMAVSSIGKRKKRVYEAMTLYERQRQR